MKAQKALQTVIFSAIVIAAGLFLLFYGIPTQIPNEVSWTGNDLLNARAMPYFSTSVLLISATLELINSMCRYFMLKKSEKEKVTPTNWKSEFKAILMFVLCLLYAVLFSKTNYIISSAICPPLALVILGDRDWRHYVAIWGVVAIMYVVFRFALGVML